MVPAAGSKRSAPDGDEAPEAKRSCPFAAYDTVDFSGWTLTVKKDGKMGPSIFIENLPQRGIKLFKGDWFKILWPVEPSKYQSPSESSAVSREDIKNLDVCFRIGADLQAWIGRVEEHLIAQLEKNSAMLWGKQMTAESIRTMFTPTVKTDDVHPPLMRCRLVLVGNNQTAMNLEIFNDKGELVRIPGAGVDFVMDHRGTNRWRGELFRCVVKPRLWTMGRHKCGVQFTCVTCLIKRDAPADDCQDPFVDE